MGPLYLSEFEKKARQEHAVIVYEDEASFRQTPTLYRTWAKRNSQPQIPTQGKRNTQKVLGAVSLYTGAFAYQHQTEYFNAETYLEFLQDVVLPSFYRRAHRVYLIVDNASYHKKPEVYEWLSANRQRIEMFHLPPYSPEHNAIERVWHYTRLQATHNRYFDTPEELSHSLLSTFDNIQECPEKILGFLKPYF